MADLQALFDAHYPDRRYLTELCDHYYCDFLSVAVLRRSREKSVRPFTHCHAAYEFLLPLTPAPQIMQGDEVYFGRVGYAYPVQSGRRHAQAVELCDVSNCSIVVDADCFERRLAEKGLAGRAVERFFAVSNTLKDYLRLFEGTVRENLVYNMQGITDEQLMRVCRACGLDKFVRSLPNGLDTVLSESTSISAGQKQLLTIARAMLQNAPMLILDEATSSVDTRTELLIQRAMDELTKGRTSFVIAHRLSTIKNADLILVMRDGDVIESGTHDELMQRGGFYAELYNSQFEQAS